MEQFSKTSKIHEYIFDYYAYYPDQVKINENKKRVEQFIKTKKINYIILFDDEATDVLIDLINSKKIPTVITAYNKKPAQIQWWKETGHKDRHFTGVWETYPFKQSIRLLNKISPAVKEISILSGNNSSAQIVTNQLISFFEENKGQYSGIRLTNKFITSKWSDWEKHIKTYKGKDKAFWIVSPWNIYNEKNEEVDLRAIGEFYRKHSPLPSLGIVNQQLGLLASFAVNSEDLGHVCQD